jgi:hypothetical protein
VAGERGKLYVFGNKGGLEECVLWGITKRETLICTTRLVLLLLSNQNHSGLGV